MVRERLHCPFCGAASTTIYARQTVETQGRDRKIPTYCAYVVCLECGGSAGTGGHAYRTKEQAKEEALTAWNRREGSIWA